MVCNLNTKHICATKKGLRALPGGLHTLDDTCTLFVLMHCILYLHQRLLGGAWEQPCSLESSSYPTLLGHCAASRSLPLSTTYTLCVPTRAEFEKNKLDIWLCWATCPGSTNSTQLLQKHACVSVAFTRTAESASSWESGFEGPSSSHSKLNPLAQPFGS